MATKKRKSRTAGFHLNPTTGDLPSPSEVNKTLSNATGKPIEEKPASKQTPRKSAESTTPKTSRKRKTKFELKAEQPVPKPPKPTRPAIKRVALTTAISPENRAQLEVAALGSNASVADLLNEALEYYFQEVFPVKDKELVKTFTTIYQRKAR